MWAEATNVRFATLAATDLLRHRAEEFYRRTGHNVSIAFMPDANQTLIDMDIGSGFPKRNNYTGYMIRSETSKFSYSRFVLA